LYRVIVGWGNLTRALAFDVHVHNGMPGPVRLGSNVAGNQVVNVYQIWI
jgi:hypothetical protein